MKDQVPDVVRALALHILMQDSLTVFGHVGWVPHPNVEDHEDNTKGIDMHPSNLKGDLSKRDTFVIKTNIYNGLQGLRNSLKVGLGLQLAAACAKFHYPFQTNTLRF